MDCSTVKCYDSEPGFVPLSIVSATQCLNQLSYLSIPPGKVCVSHSESLVNPMKHSSTGLAYILPSNRDEHKKMTQAENKGSPTCGWQVTHYKSETRIQMDSGRWARLATAHSTNRLTHVD